MFVLFQGPRSYPLGGARDRTGVFETLDAAIAAAGTPSLSEWAHVAQVSSSGLRIVAEWAPGVPDASLVMFGGEPEAVKAAYHVSPENVDRYWPSAGDPWHRALYALAAPVLVG